MVTGNVAMGYNASISYIEETAFGTVPTSPTWLEIGRITSAELSLGSEHIPIYGLDTFDRVMSPQGNESYELSLEFYINDVAWTFMKEIDDIDFFSFRIENKIGATVWVTYLVGSIIDEMTVSGSPGEPWTVSATIKAKKLDADTFTTTVKVGETEYTRSVDVVEMCHGGVLSAGATWTTEASSDHAEVTDVEFSISLNYEDNYVLNANTVEGFYAGNREYSFSFTANFDDITHCKRILDNESGQLKLEIVDAGLNIEFVGCDYDELSLPMDEGAMIATEVSGMADTCTIADA